MDVLPNLSFTPRFSAVILAEVTRKPFKTVSSDKLLLITGLKPGVNDKIPTRSEQLPRKLSHTAAKILRLIGRGGRKVLRSPGESILIFRMAIWVSILSVLVKLQPLPRALRFVAPKTDKALRRPGEERSREQTERSLAQAIDLLLGTDVLVFKPVCWKRATILHRYLALNGIATRIVFGVRKEKDGGISGHAWLETGGAPLLEKTAPDYVVTYTFPSNDPFDLELGLLTSERA